MSPELTIALLAGVVLGASAHRAGLCTVKAVGEVLNTGRANALWSFLKASLWTTGILAFAVLLGAEPVLGQRPLLPSSVLGGLLFGLGAGLNGACSFSTLTRLAEGHLVMVFTLVGWTASIALFQSTLPAIHVPPTPFTVPAALALPLAIWMAWEAWKMWQRRALIAGGFRTGFWALSPSVLLIAVANSALLLVGRPWSFTATALCTGGGVPMAPCGHVGLLWVISLVALLTMIASAWLRDSLRPRVPKAKAAIRHLAAGLAMGTGASLIPGGNDGLILFGLPALSPHALPSWLAIGAGIAIALTGMRATGLRLPKVSCEGDVCKSVP